MSDSALREEIQKRLTLNWLIQGAAQHAGMTFNHLVRDELNGMEPELVRLYDQYALVNLLQYWQPEVRMIFGSPARFWRRAASSPSHPFYGHVLLTNYGGMLAETSRKRALERCKEKRFTSVPLAFSFQAVFVVNRLRALEKPHRRRLVEVAKETASMVWGIPTERLDGELADRIVAPSTLSVHGLQGAMFRAGIVGYGCVERRGEALVVVAKGTNWQLLAKELVKGTAELVCLHGLNGLGDETYRRVIEATDRVDFEPWMLQSGGELWRRFLGTVPEGQTAAGVLMRMARMPARELEGVVAAVIESGERVSELVS
jgi:hypothetical protein